MKKLFLIFLFILLSNLLPAKALSQTTNANDIEVFFIFDYGTLDDFTAHFVINNNLPVSLDNWALGFTMQRLIDRITGARIFKQVGDYFVIKGTKTQANIPAKGSISFTIHGTYGITNKNDAPSDYFILYNDSTVPKPIVSKFLMPKKDINFNETEFDLNNKKGSIPIKSFESPGVVPLPVQINMTKAYFNLKPNTTIYVVNGNEEITKIANYLATILKPPTGYSLPIKNINTFDNQKNAIYLIKQARTPSLGEEGYQLIVTPENIQIESETGHGLFYGVQSLRQLLPPQIFNSTLQKDISWKIPGLRIIDYPRFAYRGILLDVARHFFTVDQVKRLLDLMAMHKLNVLHWHLTDDEGWRIEIKHYPQLTTIGAWRGYNEVLPPAVGSGINNYGGFYTQDQLRDIIQYAQDRYISIIPEIDIPGHARAMIQSLPQDLIDPNDHSTYTSVRGFHDNVLSPCIPSTYKVLDNIFSEIANLFPGNYIHIGSDEVPRGVWENSPACNALMKKLGLKNTEQLQNYFSKKVQDILISKHKSLAAWEEITEGGPLSKQPMPLIYYWLGDQDVKASKDGYDIILMPYPYTYFELAYSDYPKEPGEYWGGLSDTFKNYTFTPSIPEVNQKKIKGIEGALWTENIDSQQLLDFFTFPKAAALAEVAWSPANQRNWINFSNRLGHHHLQRLDNMGVLYRISPPGYRQFNNAIQANIEFPGLIIRYTTDGSEPTKNSELFTGTFKTYGKQIKMRSFDTRGRGSL